MATAPSWITTPNLGVYSETHSFNVDPLVVEFSAPNGNTVAQINGALPSGLSWLTVGSNVEITGESTEIFEPTLGQITWRITGPDSQVADRTYYLQIDPVAIPPSWVGQPQFLGYAASGNSSVYTVTAHSTSNALITYSIPQFTPPTGISINASNGQISYAAPVVSSDQTISFPVRATTGSVYSDLTVSIDLLTVPHAPAWYTASGLLAIVSEGEFVEIALVAYDSSGAAISYALVDSEPAFPFALTATGLIYGTAPSLYTTTVYQFTVSATSVNGTATQTMDIVTEPVTIGALLYWTSDADCGTIADGAYVTLDVSAASSRGPINYSIVGGILPRGLILNRQSGLISGFAEFQTRDRSYLFDIAASDGIQTIERTFGLTIVRSTQYQYLDITIPVEGSLKDLYYQYIGETVNSVWVPNSSTTPQSVLYQPFIQLISGLNYAIDDAAAAVNFANLSLNTTEIMIGAATNVNVSPTTTLFYSPILDANAGAAASYPQADNVAITATANLTIQSGPVTVIVLSDPGSWLDSATIGTTVRLTVLDTPSMWMQGSITAYVPGTTVMQILVTMTSGSGTYANWQLTLAPTYPPSLVNMRDQLIAGLGWVTDGQGSGAVLLPTIDPTTTAVTGAEIIDPGSGYLYGPSLAVIGSGNGAVMAANLTVLSANVVSAGTGWVLGDEILLMQPALTPAVLTVSNVNSNGGVTSLTVTTAGEYVCFPAGEQLITNAQGEPARINLTLGVGNVWIAAGGSNYAASGTTIGTAGHELLPSWQTTWEPYLALGTVFTEYGGRVVGNETAAAKSLLYYQRWPLQHAIIEVQGINWTGDTTFDHESTSFDGGATFWTEWTEPRDTLFDQNQTVFNQDNTIFDNPYALWQDYAYYAWGTTQFDSEFTIFDLYATIFDTGATPTASITQLRKLLRIRTQQISGHDVVV
jgi:hypothetical protein